jgi:predicted PurR-regulated permease PerM
MEQPPEQSHNGLVAFSQRIVWPLGALILIILLFRLSPLPLKHAFIIIFTSILLAAAVAPPAKILARHRIPRGVTILLIYLFVLAVLAGVVALIVPLVVGEVDTFKTTFPQYVSQLQHFVQRVAPDQASHFSSSTITSQVESRLSSFAGELTSIVFRTVSIGIDVILILVIAFFMAADENFARRLITRFVPPRHRAEASRLMGRIGNEMGQWARAQILLALFFGTAFGVGLRVIGVPYALTLGVIGGVLEIIPYVGGFITLVLAGLVALTGGPIHVLFVIAWYTVVVELEGHVIGPKLMNRVLKIEPLVVVLAIFLGGESLGILGALLAVPIAIVFQVFLDEFYSFQDARGTGDPDDGMTPRADGGEPRPNGQEGVPAPRTRLRGR